MFSPVWKLVYPFFSLLASLTKNFPPWTSIPYVPGLVFFYMAPLLAKKYMLKEKAFFP